MSRIKTSTRKQSVPVQHRSGRSGVTTIRSKDLRAQLQTNTKKGDRGHFSVNDWNRTGNGDSKPSPLM